MSELMWERLRRSLIPTDDCIPFPGSTDRYGYGQVRFQGKLRRATHVALELAGRSRPAPPHDRALHSCDNPPCVNPRHLRWGTMQDNSQDMVVRGRATPTSGARLSAHDVAAIRAQLDKGGAQQALADAFGVDASTVSLIASNKTWQGVA